MRKLVIAATLSAGLLAGCQTPDPALINQIQQEVVKDCGYIPNLEAIAALIASSSNAALIAKGALAVAEAVCAAVIATPRKSIENGSQVPKVGGVPIPGHFQ